MEDLFQGDLVLPGDAGHVLILRLGAAHPVALGLLHPHRAVGGFPGGDGVAEHVLFTGAHPQPCGGGKGKHLVDERIFVGGVTQGHQLPAGAALLHAPGQGVHVQSPLL